jgi:hypothetical protein
VGARDQFVRGAICLFVLGCHGRETAEDREPLRIEAEIDRALTQRFGVGVVTTCGIAIPPCTTLLPDGTRLPIALSWSATGWDWRVVGLVISTDQLEAYLRDEVADLGAPQGVRCAPHVRAIEPGERIECWLARGGKAFVTVRANGTTAVEIQLDAAAANARSEVVTPAREAELEKVSRDLAHADDEGDSDDESAAGGDKPPPSDAADPR